MNNKPAYSEKLKHYVAQAIENASEIADARKHFLGDIANHIKERIAGNQSVADLVFICTHNSRRSHFAHVWCAVALQHHGISNVSCWSGGTEVTACNERTVEALCRAGFELDGKPGGENPVYQMMVSRDHPRVDCYSKIYNAQPNPSSGYVALLCCSDVDERCPVIDGASARFSLHYTDPKVSDGTDNEKEVYDRRCFQIATEMFVLASELAKHTV